MESWKSRGRKPKTWAAGSQGGEMSLLEVTPEGLTKWNNSGPRQLAHDQSGPVALFVRFAPNQQKILNVNNPEAISPSYRILLRSAKTGTEEVHHIRAVDGFSVLLTEALLHVFEPGALLYQKCDRSVGFDASSPVGSLVRSVKSVARSLKLREGSTIDSLHWILIRDESDQKQEIHCIKYTVDNHLVLASSLETGFPEGGNSIRGSRSGRLFGPTGPSSRPKTVPAVRF